MYEVLPVAGLVICEELYVMTHNEHMLKKCRVYNMNDFNGLAQEAKKLSYVILSAQKRRQNNTG